MKTTEVSKEISRQGLCRSFFSPIKEMCYHVIETGFLNEAKRFLIVFEDAYQQRIGETELVTIKELKTRFGITL
jgi:hypothetical protein